MTNSPENTAQALPSYDAEKLARGDHWWVIGYRVVASERGTDCRKIVCAKCCLDGGSDARVVIPTSDCEQCGRSFCEIAGSDMRNTPLL